MTDNETIYFELKDSGDFIRIELMNLNYPNAELDWDRNWIKSNVIVKAGGFSGQFECDLMTTDFERFKKSLSQLYDKLDGTASFNTMEGQVEIKIKGDGIGHFEADCSVMDDAGIGNKLDFEINFDQTIISEMVRQLNDITKTYPISGDLKIKK
ncbi:WapI family immunity protein [Algoriphagus halophilus]|uniref:Uncharacterized protein n=1 Tax=Algoriphagus halophilus TaxID=226505 RepID=A0A1N6DGW7_9BACT|nr:hypothetical protein [Algoriphagus halophilus]SIN70035.1 hypothetical protein SAMN05444394_0893 [Algoriphagus halophilus]